MELWDIVLAVIVLYGVYLAGALLVFFITVPVMWFFVWRKINGRRR